MQNFCLVYYKYFHCYELRGKKIASIVIAMTAFLAIVIYFHTSVAGFIPFCTAFIAELHQLIIEKDF